MNKLLFKSLLLIACLLGSVTASAFDFESGGIYYNITSSEDKTVEVTNREEENSYSGSVVISASVTNEGTTYRVTSIGENAFGFCTDLTGVTIPNSVTLIEGGAFMGCEGLTSVTIPNLVTEIGEGAFGGCKGLKEFIVDSRNTSFSVLEGVLFNKNKTTIIVYPYAKSPTYTIPNSVTEIGAGAFDRCSGLTSVIIPNSVTKIGVGAFSDCEGLTSVTIPNSVTLIDLAAFQYCFSLKSVTLGNSVKKIENFAFENCTGLTDITIPNSVTKIGVSAFQLCDGLTSVTIGNSVKSIDKLAFDRCKSLTSVTIPKSVTSISEDAFHECTGLTDFIVASENPNYSALDGVLLNKNKTKFIAYPSAKSSTTYTIPNSVTSIGEFAFFLCKHLTGVTISNSVTKIGDWAFVHCEKLTDITIPNSVTSIGSQAFRSCTGLKEIYNYSKAPQSVEANAFNEVDMTKCTLYVPIGSKAGYSAADVWKDFTNIQEFDPI